MTITVMTYNNSSESLKEIRGFVPIRIIRQENSMFRGAPDKRVLNWGCSSIENAEVLKCNILNHPLLVELAVDKRKFFERISSQENSREFVPLFTNSREEAHDLLENIPSGMLFARTSLRGRGGKGIIKCTTHEDIDRVKEGTLFVEYVRKKDEYRVHIFKGVYLGTSKKLISRAARFDQTVDYEVRNTNNGYIFGRIKNSAPKKVIQAATTVMENSGLDFGALDVVHNIRYDRAVVLEINTAPGVMGTTARVYASALAEEFGEEVSEYVPFEAQDDVKTGEVEVTNRVDYVSDLQRIEHAVPQTPIFDNLDNEESRRRFRYTFARPLFTNTSTT